jgi:hypothetical protein
MAWASVKDGVIAIRLHVIYYPLAWPEPKSGFFLLLYKSYSTVAQAPSGVCEHDDVA